jgi:hypothetical protein
VSRMLEDMQRRGIIEESDNPWSSPVVLVRKKNGELRSCVDYRKLNSVTKKDCFLVLASRCTPRRQRENCILDRSRVLAVYSPAIWTQQRSSYFREVNGNSPTRLDVRFMPRVLGRRHRGRPHIPRAAAELAIKCSSGSEKSVSS